MSNYSLIELNDIVVTQGLNDYLGKEISVLRGDYNLEDINLVLEIILDYVKLNDSKLKNGETIGIGSWMIKFSIDNVYIELHELKDVVKNSNVYEFDLKNTISFLKGQNDICSRYKVNLMFPLIGQKIAVSKEIYDGSEVNAVRYDAPSHMTGWYLTSNEFNGDVNTLIVDHLFHLLKVRPDIAKYLALPAGYRFFKDELGDKIWFDEDIIADEEA